MTTRNLIRPLALAPVARLLTVTFMLALAPCPAPGGPPPALDWNPARTWVFAVGVLEFQDPEELSSFDALGRCDSSLLELLRAKGVPKDHVIHLQDRRATLAEIRKRLDGLLARTAPGDLLLIYYAGHGFVVDGVCYAANYDCSDEPRTWWPMQELIDRLEAGFRGERVMLMFDCCYSGRIVELAQAKGRRLSYAAFGSALSSESSTENWTFTEAMLAGLSGDPVVDLDGDGAIQARELAQYASDELRVFAEQNAASVFTGTFSPETVLGLRHGVKRHARTGERVKVLYDGEWWQARIVTVRGKEALCHWIDSGYHRRQDEEWMPLSAVRPMAP